MGNMISIPRQLAFLLVAIAWPAVSAVAITTEQTATQRWARFEPEFQAFRETDRAKQPTSSGILFVGSSIFRQWTNVAEMMAPLPVLNRAFGGSRTGDQLARFDQVVSPYQPKIIVYYCGSNDLKAGDTPEDPAAIFARFHSFSIRVRQMHPTPHLVFISSTRSPDRVLRWTQVDHYNALARAYCAATVGHTFIDVNPALVDAAGSPRVELYKTDRLHFNPPAYLAFTALIKPVLERIWRESSTAESSRN
jgi:lysophospholipase L1-like esterase